MDIRKIIMRFWAPIHSILQPTDLSPYQYLLIDKSAIKRGSGIGGLGSCTGFVFTNKKAMHKFIDGSIPRLEKVNLLYFKREDEHNNTRTIL